MELGMRMGLKVIVLAVVFGGLAGMLSFGVLNALPPNGDALVREFYEIENAVHVSPHSLRKMMDKGDKSYVLVDLRSAEEYEAAHIAGAASIPAYKDKDTSDYGAVERIVRAFAALPKDKDIIVYCYSTPCMTGRKVGKLLAGHGIFVKHLGIGWNEWKYDWNAWNHEHEWEKTNAEDYITTGKEPGTPQQDSNSTACPIEGGFGC
ncbi:MAG: rhodanese-like domain-containing protein [Candidatus Diapherotrites archaeon]|nr:rhodanese-like domain-containing protein [Candidatus Diapherotrites archaeon]